MIEARCEITISTTLDITALVSLKICAANRERCGRGNRLVVDRRGILALIRLALIRLAKAMDLLSDWRGWTPIYSRNIRDEARRSRVCRHRDARKPASGDFWDCLFKDANTAKTALLPAPFWCTNAWNRPTSTGARGSDPLWLCWRGKPSCDPGIRLRSFQLESIRTTIIFGPGAPPHLKPLAPDIESPAT